MELGWPGYRDNSFNETLIATFIDIQNKIIKQNSFLNCLTPAKKQHEVKLVNNLCNACGKDCHDTLVTADSPSKRASPVP
jgi:hypothetical protein